MVKYRSTRGAVRGNTFEATVMTGLAPDRGLFVPESIPQVTAAQLEQWKNLSFQDECLACFRLRRDMCLPSLLAGAYGFASWASGRLP